MSSKEDLHHGHFSTRTDSAAAAAATASEVLINKQKMPEAAQANLVASQDVTARPARLTRPNYNQLHAKPLPLQTYPLPAFIPQNPLSIIRIAYAFFSSYINHSSSHPRQSYCAYYSAATRSVHVTDELTARALWESGFFGKGSLSRSEPEWLERERRRLGIVGERANATAAEVTRKRREERQAGKRERARLEREELEAQLRKEGKLVAVDASTETTAAPSGETDKTEPDGNAMQSQNENTSEQRRDVDSGTTTVLRNQEHLQLIPYEAFFLAYALGILDVLDPNTGQHLNNGDLLKLFRYTSFFPPLAAKESPPVDDPFTLNYVVYHHFRSLGWVVRPGVKFSVDLLLYNRGPVFSHAEFAVLIVPDYSGGRWATDEKLRKLAAAKNQDEWWWLHAANRVQGQVKKTLILAYVEVPAPVFDDASTEEEQDIGSFLQSYRVKEMLVRRWTANRNR